MSTSQPPYTITPEILNRVAAISEAIRRLGSDGINGSCQSSLRRLRGA